MELETNEMYESKMAIPWIANERMRSEKLDTLVDHATLIRAVAQCTKFDYILRLVAVLQILYDYRFASLANEDVS